MTEHTHIQLIVDYEKGQTRYFAVPPGKGWRFDTTHRQLIVGVGIPRTHVPLDNVLNYDIQHYECRNPECPMLQNTASEEPWPTENKSTMGWSPPSTDLSPSVLTSSSSGETMSLPTELAMVLTTISGYQAALRQMRLADNTPWSRLPDSIQKRVIGQLAEAGSIISSHPRPQ